MLPREGISRLEGTWLKLVGKTKIFKQIANQPDSYLAVDQLEIGMGNKIPLWLFGFLY